MGSLSLSDSLQGVAMLDPTRPTPIWVVWPYLTWLERLLFIALIVLGIYVLFSVAVTVFRVRKGGAAGNGDSSDAQKILAALRKRSTGVDKLITTGFYLFGWVLFLGLQNAYFIIDNSKATAEWIILRSFEPHLAFAANAFFVLLMLHIAGWFISARVGRLASPPTPR
jgi:hypothetical protein